MQTRSMARRAREETSVLPVTSSTDKVLSTSLRVVVEEKLREESTSFLHFPVITSTTGRTIINTGQQFLHLPAETGFHEEAAARRGKRFLARHHHQRHRSQSRRRRRSGETRSRTWSNPASIMKARACPLSSFLVASILTKVDNDLRQIAAARSLGTISSSSDDSTKGSSSVLGRADVLDASPDTDYDPDDRDPSTLPSESVRETERYAYCEDDFDAYLGKAMRTTSFFSSPPASETLSVPVPSIPAVNSYSYKYTD
jgi:hypothetical protein